MVGSELNPTNTNRWYFNFDGQLDNKIITGIQTHCGYYNGQPSVYTGQDFASGTIYNIATNYADFYTVPLLLASAIDKVYSNGFLSLVNPQNRFFWYQQPLSSLNVKNTSNKFKRLYSRITLDKCYVEAPLNIPFGTGGVPSTFYLPFTFYYLDDPNF